MVSIGRVTFVVIVLAGLAGCASMNKSECLIAAILTRLSWIN